MQSKSGQIKWQDLLSVLRTTALMFGPTVLIFMLEQISALDFGSWTIIVGAIVGVLVKILQKFAQDNIYRK